MRAVVDTVVLVRAVIKPLGPVGPVLLRLRDGAYTPLYTTETLEELVDVLNRPRIKVKYRLKQEDIEAVIRLVLLRGEFVLPNRKIVVCRDPKDNKFLEAAAAGNADAIVTTDEDLLALNPFEGIPIIHPARFLAML